MAIELLAPAYERLDLDVVNAPNSVSGSATSIE